MRTLSLVVALVLAAPAVAAQVDLPRFLASGGDSGWATVGVGAGTPAGFAGMATLNFGSRRVAQVSGLMLGDLLGDEDQQPHAYVLHAGYGLSRAGRTGRLAAAVGPALLGGNRSLRGENDRYLTPGAALNLQATLSAALGVGLNVTVAAGPGVTTAAVGISMVLEGEK